MMHFRKNSPQARRFAERRRREDEAPRLRDEVPSLLTLELEIEDRSSVAEGSGHRRRIVVEHAPALFLVPCGDSRCIEGGHDLTPMIMRALRAHDRTFQGSEPCLGSIGPSPCPRVLTFTAVATYRHDDEKEPAVPGVPPL